MPNQIVPKQRRNLVLKTQKMGLKLFGTGFRYKIARLLGVNMGADFAWGNGENFTLYLEVLGYNEIELE